MSIFNNRSNEKIRKVNTFKHYTMVGKSPMEWDFGRADRVYFLKEVKALKFKDNLPYNHRRGWEWPNLDEDAYEESVCPMLKEVKVKERYFADGIVLIAKSNYDYWLNDEYYLVSKEALDKYAVSLYTNHFKDYTMTVKGPKTNFEWPALGFCSRKDKTYSSFLNSADDNLKKMTFPLLSFFLFTQQEVTDSFAPGIVDTFSNALKLYNELDLSSIDIEKIISNLSSFMDDIHKTVASMGGYVEHDEIEDLFLLMDRQKKENLEKEEERKKIEDYKRGSVDDFIKMTNSRRDLLKQFNEI